MVAAGMMASWLTLCSTCRPSPDLESQDTPLDDIQVEDDRRGASRPLVEAKRAAIPTQPAGAGAAAESPVAAPSDAPPEALMICPVSGLSTLEGVCPFAKPAKARKAKEEVKRKLNLKLDFQWEEEGNSFIRISCRPRLADHFEALELPCSASKEDIKRQYHKLALAHHPDKNPDSDAAKERFQRIERAFQVLKDTNGEMSFPWDEHPDAQRTMTGDDAVRTLAKLGMEAWDHHHLEALQLRHMVRLCPEVRLLIRTQDSDTAQSYTAECWVDALCIDPSSGSEHVVKLYRRELDPAAKVHYNFAPEDFREEKEQGI